MESIPASPRMSISTPNSVSSANTMFTAATESSPYASRKEASSARDSTGISSSREIAARIFFGNEIHLSPSQTFDLVFRKVKKGVVGFGVIPIENSLAGSIHKGRVTRVLPGMQSAFVDIGLDRDAFLYVSDFFEDNEEQLKRHIELLTRRG